MSALQKRREWRTQSLVSDWDKAIEAAVRLLKEGAKRHWLACEAHDDDEPSMTEADAHLCSAIELEGFATALRALKGLQ